MDEKCSHKCELAWILDSYVETEESLTWWTTLKSLSIISFSTNKQKIVHVFIVFTFDKMCPVVLLLLKLDDADGAWLNLFLILSGGFKSVISSFLGNLNVLIFGEGTKDSFLPTKRSMFELVICCFSWHNVNY